MGVKIVEILPRKEISVEHLANRRVAVDAFNWIYQFLAIIRQPDGTPLRDSKGRVTSHLSGLFYRTAKLLEARITPVYVFDGKPPELKYVTAERAERKLEATVKWREALERGDEEEARKYAQQTSRLTAEMVKQAKELLEAMGVSVVQAPSEGEAQCAWFAKHKKVYAVASQDTDSLLFGAPLLIRNLSITGKRKIAGKKAFVDVEPQEMSLEAALRELDLTQDQLVMLGMLVGTDFNPGVKGVGPKTALKIVREEKTFEKVFAKVAAKWEGPDPKDVFEIFKKPPVDDLQIIEHKLNPEKLRKMLVDEFEFSLDRVNKIIDGLQKKPSQPGLGKWVK